MVFLSNDTAWLLPRGHGAPRDAAWPLHETVVLSELAGLLSDSLCLLSQVARLEPSRPTKGMRPAPTVPSTAGPLRKGPPIASAATATTEQTWTRWTCPAQVRPGPLRVTSESTVACRKAQSEGWAAVWLQPALLSEEQPVPGGRGNAKLVGKGPSWGSPWGGRAANMQIPQSWHLAPYPLLSSHVENKVKVLIHKGTKNGRVGRERPNTGGVCGGRGCPVF